MPFKSRRQLRLCFAEQQALLLMNKTPTWDCDKILMETENPELLPERPGMPNSKETPPLTKKEERCTKEICTGKKGGQYIIRAKQKIYIPKGGEPSFTETG